MTLCKKFTIALLCTCLYQSFSCGMEQPQKCEENKKEINEATHPAYGLYKEAILHLHSHLKDPNNTAHVSAAASRLQLASERGHLMSEKLLPFVRICLQDGLNKSEGTHDSSAAQCAIHFSTGCYSDGYNLLLVLLKHNYNGTRSLIDQILAEESRCTFFFKKFKTLGENTYENIIFSISDITRIRETFLDHFMFSDINMHCDLKIRPYTQAVIGKIYIDASLNIPESNSSAISFSKLEGLGAYIPNKKLSYFCEGVKFCFSAAKQKDQDAYETLTKALRETRDYEAFFTQLLPSFKTGDEQSQDLFNRVAFQDYQVLLGFDRYAAGLLISAKNSDKQDLEAIVDRVRSNYDRFKKDHYQHGRPPTIRLDSGYAAQTPIQGIDDKDSQNDPLLPQTESQKKYNAAMNLWDAKPEEALKLLLECGRDCQEAKDALQKIRQSVGYREPHKAKNDLVGPLLKDFDKKEGTRYYNIFDDQFLKKSKKHQFSDDDIAKLAMSLLQANKYGNGAAKEQVKKLKRSIFYKKSNKSEAKTPYDRLAHRFRCLEGAHELIIECSNVKSSIEGPKLQSTPQTMQVSKPKLTNENTNVASSTQSPETTTAISSPKEKEPREVKANQEIVTVKSSDQQDYANNQFSLGFEHYQQGRDEEAFKCFQDAAAYGHAKAKYNLGIMHLEGRGVKSSNAKEAFKLIKQAADLKFIDAIYKLGLMYLEGEGVARNEKYGIRLIKRVAEAGDIRAELKMGFFYLEGTGVKKNEKKGFEIIKGIADRGDPHRQHDVGILYLKGIGVEMNAAMAITYLQKAADQNHPGASNKLGTIYYQGIGVIPNANKAFRYFETAALQKDPEALFNLASMYELGGVVKSDPIEAEKLYQESYKLGFNPVEAHKAVMELQESHIQYFQRIVQSTAEIEPIAVTDTRSDPLLHLQLVPQNVTPPVVDVAPKIEKKTEMSISSDAHLLPKKRDHKGRDKKKDEGHSPALQMVNDQLPTESREESIAPSERTIKSIRTLPTQRRKLQKVDTHSRLEHPSSSLESVEEGSVSKENLLSPETPKTEVRERKTLHRSQSVKTLSSSSKPSERASFVGKRVVNTNEIAKDEGKSRRTIHRTKSLNQFSPVNHYEEFSVKKEKTKKKNKSPITKISAKEHLSSKKKLERRDSERKLSQSASEEMSDYSSSEISTSDKPLVDFFKQDGKRDENLKHLKRLFNNRDLIKASDIKLNRSIVVRALRELGANGKKIITWNFETPGNKNTSIIRADIIRTPDHSKNQELPTLNIHLHSRQGKWYEDPNIKEHFLKFICACDPSVKALVGQIQKNNTNSSDESSYGFF